MDRSSIITLISESWEKDEYGVEQPSRSAREIYASVQSVSGYEIVEFGRNGINPEIKFVVFGPDYAGEKLVSWKDNIYSVYRTYIAKTDMIEIYCERRGGTDGILQ